MAFPRLPAGASYIKLSNPSRRNALSLAILRNLTNQLITYSTNKSARKSLLLPEFKYRTNDSLINNNKWLVDSEEWERELGHQPKVLVLRSEGRVFSSGHDLSELVKQGDWELKETFDTCRELMNIMMSHPIPIVCAVQGLATAAGFQLAMASDYPIAMADTQFQLPGATIGLPCTLPSVYVSQRVPPALVQRLLLTGEPVRADQLHGAVDVVPVPPHAKGKNTRKEAFEKRINDVVQRLVNMPSQPQAFGKWAFQTQLGLHPHGRGPAFAARMMEMHTNTEDGKEGINAFLEKRSPNWKS